MQNFNVFAKLVVVVVVVGCWTRGSSAETNGSVALVDYFKECKAGDLKFDECMMNALNDVRSLFGTGVPEYGILPFDPHFAKEVVQKRGGPGLKYTLRLTDVYEEGWDVSEVTKFKSDPKNYRIKYTQKFPDKKVRGNYHFQSFTVGYPFSIEGAFNISLYNYVQTTTITRPPTLRNGTDGFGPLKVRIVNDRVGNMKVHVSNLLGGRATMENLLDRMINVSWRPGYAVLRPIIDDIVSSAFTKIFNDSFGNFPFAEIFP